MSHLLNWYNYLNNNFCKLLFKILTAIFLSRRSCFFFFANLFSNILLSTVANSSLVKGRKVGKSSSASIFHVYFPSTILYYRQLFIIDWFFESPALLPDYKKIGRRMYECVWVLVGLLLFILFSRSRVASTLRLLRRCAVHSEWKPFYTLSFVAWPHVRMCTHYTPSWGTTLMWPYSN